jgi:hypothetical protein
MWAVAAGQLAKGYDRHGTAPPLGTLPVRNVDETK